MVAGSSESVFWNRRYLPTAISREREMERRAALDLPARHLHHTVERILDLSVLANLEKRRDPLDDASYYC